MKKLLLFIIPFSLILLIVTPAFASSPYNWERIASSVGVELGNYYSVFKKINSNEFVLVTFNQAPNRMSYNSNTDSCSDFTVAPGYNDVGRFYTINGYNPFLASSWVLTGSGQWYSGSNLTHLYFVDSNYTLNDSYTGEAAIPNYGDSIPSGGIFNSNSVMGVLDEIISGLPILVPILITFIAIRKGINFTLSMLRSA